MNAWFFPQSHIHAYLPVFRSSSPNSLPPQSSYPLVVSSCRGAGEIYSFLFLLSNNLLLSSSPRLHVDLLVALPFFLWFVECSGRFIVDLGLAFSVWLFSPPQGCLIPDWTKLGFSASSNSATFLVSEFTLAVLESSPISIFPLFLTSCVGFLPSLPHFYPPSFSSPLFCPHKYFSPDGQILTSVDLKHK